MPNCKSCGKTIVWGVTEAGTKIPLDPAPQVYQLDAIDYDSKDKPFGNERTSYKVSRSKSAMVSHFITCPNANQHSKKGKSS